MTDKTIKDRGISTLTLQSPTPFSFDKETRRQELIFYYQYAVANSLITVTGEQSRTTLIRKTFNDLGASGDTWNEAMTAWLQAIIPSAEVDLYKLWLGYFIKYATTPDAKGVTYGGLSVESGYRRFLSDNIAGGSSTNPYQSNFIEPLRIADRAVFKKGKIFADSVSPADVVNFLVHYIKTFSDSVTLSDAIMAARRKFFNESLTITDATLAQLSKGFTDNVAVTDVLVILMNLQPFFADSAILSDLLAYKWNIGKSDSFSLSDAATYARGKSFSDSISFSDSMSITIGFLRLFFDALAIDDVILFKVTKTFADSVNISEAVHFGYAGYNSGVYNEGVYNPGGFQTQGLPIFADNVSISDSVIFSIGGYNNQVYNAGVYNL